MTIGVGRTVRLANRPALRLCSWDVPGRQRGGRVPAGTGGRMASRVPDGTSGEPWSSIDDRSLLYNSRVRFAHAIGSCGADSNSVLRSPGEVQKRPPAWCRNPPRTHGSPSMPRPTVSGSSTTVRGHVSAPFPVWQCRRGGVQWYGSRTHTIPCYRFRLATHTIMRNPNKGRYGRDHRHRGAIRKHV